MDIFKNFDELKTVEQVLTDLLKFYGVEEIKVSKTFDPQFCRIVAKEEITGDEEDIEILKIIRSGYMMNDKILRHTDVKVQIRHKAEESLDSIK